MMWHFGGCPAAGRHDPVHASPFMVCLFLLSVDKEKCALFHIYLLFLFVHEVRACSHDDDVEGCGTKVS